MLNDLVDHPLFQLSGWATGFLGLVIGYYFYRKTRNKKSLRYTFKDTKLMARPENFGEAIAVSYGGTVVGKLRRVGVLLWNTGDVTINFQDDLHSIRFTLSEGDRILAMYIAADDASGGFKIDPIASEALIKFDYLRSNEGVLFYIDYEGRGGKGSLDIKERTRHLSRRGTVISNGASLLLMFLGGVMALLFFGTFTVLAFLLPIRAIDLVSVALASILGVLALLAFRWRQRLGKARGLYSKEFAE